MAKKPLPNSSAGRRHDVLPTYSLAARLAQGLTNEQATSSLVDKRSNRHIYKVPSLHNILYHVIYLFFCEKDTQPSYVQS
ncbi:hypothetical protein TRIUR3_21810 [Triticum urartu]|uniref:Uncharacterized protein n=1 Tax=Triticum urartu TaxID=4572 RepID=M7Z192_TRIUA|nr:hypothetical protein TRIUR3_21810 [Triticum urartu]